MRCYEGQSDKAFWIWRDHYWSGIRQCRALVLLSPAEYRATTRISVGIDNPESYDPYFIQTELEIIQSEDVLGKVVEILNLNSEWGRKYAWGKTLTTSETVWLLKRRLICILSAIQDFSTSA